MRMKISPQCSEIGSHYKEDNDCLNSPLNGTQSITTHITVDSNLTLRCTYAHHLFSFVFFFSFQNDPSPLGQTQMPHLLRAGNFAFNWTWRQWRTRLLKRKLEHAYWQLLLYNTSFHSSLCLAKSHVDNVFQCKVLFVLLNEAMISINSVNEDSFLHIATHQ